MAEERGISESELVTEINQARERVFETSDKFKHFEGYAAGQTRVYAQHLSAVESYERLVEMGKKYFPESDWKKYGLAVNSTEMGMDFEMAFLTEVTTKVKLNSRVPKN